MQIAITLISEKVLDSTVHEDSIDHPGWQFELLLHDLLDSDVSRIIKTSITS